MYIRCYVAHMLCRSGKSCYYPNGDTLELDTLSSLYVLVKTLKIFCANIWRPGLLGEIRGIRMVSKFGKNTLKL